jgi:heme-degrading monooxygenase HmoA
VKRREAVPYILIQHNIADYDRFEAIFKDDAARRQRSGSKGGTLYRNAADPTNIIVLFEWDSVERAGAFANSYELKEAVEWAGDTPPVRAIVMEEFLRTDA